MVKAPESAMSSSDDSDSDASSEEESLQTPSSLLTAEMKSAEPNPADSGSESDDDLPLNSIVSKPTDDGSKLKRPRSRPNSKPNSSPSPMKTPMKRHTSAATEKDSKKPKTGEEGKKSVLFQRLWSDDDEIVILKGMIDYEAKKGWDPMEDATDFTNFIKDSVHVNVDRKQVVSKVRRLQKRFKNSTTRKTFNPHEKIIIELSKKIWGKDTKGAVKAETKEAAVNNGSCSHEMKEEVGNSVQFLGKASASMGLDEAIVKVGLGMCSEEKKAALEEKWRKLHLEESDLFLRKLDLARQESEMITEALRSS